MPKKNVLCGQNLTFRQSSKKQNTNIENEHKLLGFVYRHTFITNSPDMRVVVILVSKAQIE